MNARSTAVGKYIFILVTLTLTSLSFNQVRAFSPEQTFVKSNLDFLRIMSQQDVATIIFLKVDRDKVETGTSLRYHFFNVIASGVSEATLFWVTENEINNDHFEVERSFDKKEFNTIGLVFGPEDNLSGPNKYSFVDKSEALKHHKVVYYRLRQIDLDGKFSYSVIYTVRFNQDLGSSSIAPFVEIFPNPCMEKINVNFNSIESGIAAVRMIDVNGLVVGSKELGVLNGLNSIQLTGLSAKRKGLYLVELTINGDIIYTQKIIKR